MLMAPWPSPRASNPAERETAKAMIGKIAPRKRRITVAADKNYDTFGFTKAMRELNVTPHVTQNTTKKGRRSSIDGRTTRHSSYAASQKFRKRIEEVFGWLKTVGLFRKTRYRGNFGLPPISSLSVPPLLYHPEPHQKRPARAVLRAAPYVKSSRSLNPNLL